MTEKQSLTTLRILDAATEIFAAVGFNGARMDEIARRAGVNKAMIYYHVGAKEALYAAVLHGAIGHVADSISARIETGTTPEAKLRAYIRGFVDAVEGNPRMGPILLREIASGGQKRPDPEPQGKHPRGGPGPGSANLPPGDGRGRKPDPPGNQKASPDRGRGNER